MSKKESISLILALSTLSPLLNNPTSHKSPDKRDPIRYFPSLTRSRRIACTRTYLPEQFHSRRANRPYVLQLDGDVAELDPGLLQVVVRKHVGRKACEEKGIDYR
ncbi:hypothetical protein CDAR_241051 [Caerostris darwini]|uniref:Uncharacterized protein n=1 Tax=Caerostris darwini TaxID=1538125 RepID=A0AAV4TF11_9ARAC|nr:hypothetical protein CDAR_241051 [Caerostris darwini]